MTSACHKALVDGVKAYLQKTAMTQKELARKACVSVSILKNAMATGQVSEEKLQQICEAAELDYASMQAMTTETEETTETEAPTEPGETAEQGEPAEPEERAESKLIVTANGWETQMNEPASRAFALAWENDRLQAELEAMEGEKERLEKALQEAEEEAYALKDEKIGAAYCHHQEMRDLKAKAFDILCRCMLPR